MGGDSLFVVNVDPVAQSTNFQPSGEIVIDFNSQMDNSSFTDTTFMVWGRWSGVHKGTIVFNSIGTIAYFNPDNNFFYRNLPL